MTERRSWWMWSVRGVDLDRGGSLWFSRSGGLAIVGEQSRRPKTQLR
jgi:hypothetical protein